MTIPATKNLQHSQRKDTMNCTCEQPTNDCPEHGTGCDGRRYMAVKAQRDELRIALALARSMLLSREPMTEKAEAVIEGALAGV